MAKRILIDQHHDYLTESLYMLFQDRLGYEVFTPVGMEWFKDGYWAINDIEATAIQYLSPGSRPYPAYEPIKHRNSMTLEDFKKTEFDLILASLPSHVQPFIKLRDLYQPKAKLIMQIGNQWSFDTSFPIRNILASAKIPPLPGFNVVEYHQEFDTKIFNYEPAKDTHKIFCFINCIGVVDLYRPDWTLFLRLEELLPEWEFKSFGGQTRDGALSTPEAVATKMKEATFIFHSKNQSDGFGHAVHQGMAVGRPILVNYGDYKDKLAGQKLIPGVNCINVDNRTPESLAQEIRAVAESPQLMEMGMNIYNKFKELVNYDREELQIRDFLSRLQ